VIVPKRPFDEENKRRIRNQVQRWAEVGAGSLAPREWILGMVVAMRDVRTIMVD
jgi:hypothetical protein